MQAKRYTKGRGRRSRMFSYLTSLLFFLLPVYQVDAFFLFNLMREDAVKRDEGVKQRGLLTILFLRKLRCTQVRMKKLFN